MVNLREKLDAYEVMGVCGPTPAEIERRQAREEYFAGLSGQWVNRWGDRLTISLRGEIMDGSENVHAIIPAAAWEERWDRAAVQKYLDTPSGGAA